MPLWHPVDPLGLAVARKVLVGSAVFIALVGLSRTLRAGDPFAPYAIIGGGILAAALFVDPLVRVLLGRRRAR